MVRHQAATAEAVVEAAPDRQVTEAAAGVAVHHHVEAGATAVVVEADSDEKWNCQHFTGDVSVIV